MARNATAIAIAGGAVAVALIDALTKNNMLTADTARKILTDAKARLKPHETMLPEGGGPGGNVIPNPDVIEAERIIGDLFKGLS